VSARRLARAHSIADLRDMARAILPRMVFDALEGGAGAEETLAENREALRRVGLVPRSPVDVSQRSTGIDLFGAPSAFPVVVGPTGLASAFWPNADTALARAAARAGVPFVMSSGAGATPEEIAAASDGRKWFQLYMPPDRAVAAQWLARVRAADFELVEVTVDGAVPGSRMRDARNGFSMPLKWTPAKALQVAMRPGWALRVARHGVPVAALRYPPDGVARPRMNTRGEALRHRFDAAFDWDGVKWLRDQWKGPLVVKGLSDPGAVEPALAIGIDGIVVSNHGGRQLDGSVAPITMLPEFAAAGAGRLTLLVDSGFRSGTDVLKGLALGATAVQVGRATLFGLTVAGEDGAYHALQILRREIDNAMALCGVTAPGQLTPDWVRVRP
jgi:(S)-mandelate dehydrogenase